MPATNATKAASPKKLPHKIYTVHGQKRALFTFGTGAKSRLMDVPAALLEVAATGRNTPDSYLLEEGLCPHTNADELEGVLGTYLAVAEREQTIPATWFAMDHPADARAA
jgi:hypothetical protein